MSSDLLLVVDDNKPSREVLARRLQREGYEVIMAENGTIALEMLANHPVTLMLLDLDMPDLSGLEVIDRARVQFPLSQLPIVMVSATTDSPKMAHAIDRGANDFLTKPVSFEIMLAKIRQYLRMRVKGPVHVPPTLKETESGRLLIDPSMIHMVAHYKLHERLGKGGAGSVYRATDTRLLREVALKIVSGGSGGKAAHERFLTEGRAVARIDHPGVVRIHEMGLTPCRFIAMELIHGETLAEYADGGISVSQACDLVLQLLDALRAVHAKGVIHRDLKPANIMVTSDGRIKVFDFGLAHTGEVDPASLTMDGMCGTPLYMSPEHISDAFGIVDEQSDLFAVAAILYELLTGYPPFLAQSVEELLKAITTTVPDSPRKLRPEVPDGLQRACLKGLSKHKSDRYPDADAFAQALRETGPYGLGRFGLED